MQQSISSKPIRSVGIVGAGIMGSAIAAVHLDHGLRVVLVDQDEEALARARQSIDAAPSASLLLTTKREALADCELVLESIVENVSAKQRLYAELEPLLSPDAILASNTSTIPIGRLGAKLARPGRFCGLHFCHPVRHRPLVEVVRGTRTDEQTIGSVLAHVGAIKKMPIVVEDGPGFVINRLLFAYLSEAMSLVLGGVDLMAVERAMLDFGASFGPFEMLDEIGLDTSFQAGLVLSEIFGDRLAGTPLLVQMVKAAQLGRKSGAGFFIYPEKTVNPIAARLIAQWKGTNECGSPSPIAVRLMSAMGREARRIIEEGKVRDPQDIELGVVHGLGFPAVQGGLFPWIDACPKS